MKIECIVLRFQTVGQQVRVDELWRLLFFIPMNDLSRDGIDADTWFALKRGQEMCARGYFMLSANNQVFTYTKFDYHFVGIEMLFCSYGMQVRQILCAL